MEEILEKLRQLILTLPEAEDRVAVARHLYNEFAKGKPLFVIAPDGETFEFPSLEKCRLYFVSKGYACDRAAISKAASRNKGKGGTMYGHEIFRLKKEELQDGVEDASAILDTSTQNNIE